MRRLMILTFAVLTGLATISAAQENKVVVELYTSQGCSSCPPADALLTELAQRDDLIALALHVDYWDYIGWKDSFGQAAFTKRQHSYARAANATTVYTPQMVIAGQDHVIGSKPMDVMDHVQRRSRQLSDLGLVLTQQGGALSIKTNRGSNAGPMVVQIVRYIPQETVSIKRGENAGRSIRYANIVTSWDVIERWDGAAALDISTPLSGTQPLAVIVQREGHGPIVAAATLR